MSREKKDDTINKVLSPHIKKVISDPKNLTAFLAMIRKWFDKNHAILSDNALYKRPMFTPDEALMVYSVVGLDESYVHEQILLSRGVDTRWDFMQEEAKSGISSWICYTLMVRHLLLAKRDKEANVILMFMAMRMYATLYSRRFKFEPKREIIDYVVANLSNKFDIKRLGSFYKAMQKLVDSSDDKYKNGLMSKDDSEFLNYVTSLRTRIKGFVGNFFNEFMIARESGAYLNTDEVSTGGGDEDFLPERSSDSQRVVSKAKDYAIKFVSTKIDDTLVMRCARQSDVSYREIQNVLQNTQRDKEPIMYNIVAALLSLYVNEHRDPDLKKIKSSYWVQFAMSQFIKTNTTNPSIIAIKDNFNIILERYCDRFTRTKREATRSSYRKALMLYISLDLQKKM